MTSLDFMEAMSRIDDSYIQEVVSCMNYKNGISVRRYMRSLLVATLIVSLFAAMGAAAYAADFLGIRTLLRPGNVEFDGTEYSEISISQPQAIPDDMNSKVTAKLENSRLAWEEWNEYKKQANEQIRIPEAFQNEPDNVSAMEVQENDDGTWTCIYMSGTEVIEQRVISNEEYEYMLEFMEMTSKGYDSGYDFNYGVDNAEQAEKLEEIAAKYGLKLRGEAKLAFSSDTTGQTGANFYTNEELAAMTADFGCAGNIFSSTPAGFDKVYWFDEGSFAVSYYLEAPSNGEQLRCYGYNSMYSTLSSGAEVYNWEEDAGSFTEQNHTAPDGTELTILSNGKDAYIFAWLENSFYAQHVWGDNGIDDADLEYVADFINYSLIGK